MTDESEENLESPVGSDFEENPAVFKASGGCRGRGLQRVYSLFFWCTLKCNLPKMVTPDLRDKFNFRSIYSLNSKVKNAVFKDVISSIHLKAILYFRVGN